MNRERMICHEDVHNFLEKIHPSAVTELIEEYWRRYDIHQPQCKEGEIYTLEDDTLGMTLWVSYSSDYDAVIIISDHEWKEGHKKYGKQYGVEIDPCNCPLCRAN